jgi:hypothetical protein
MHCIQFQGDVFAAAHVAAIVVRQEPDEDEKDSGWFVKIYLQGDPDPFDYSFDTEEEARAAMLAAAVSLRGA